VGDWVLLRLDPRPADWAQLLPGDLGDWVLLRLDPRPADWAQFLETNLALSLDI
jgi:hypothetical protein